VRDTERDSRLRTVRAGHRAANRLVDILELLAKSPEGLALRDVSAQLEAPKSSLLPLLRALTARGYLAQGRAGEYRLGPGALDLGAAAPAQRELVEVARPAVVDLMRRTGETVFVGVLSSDRHSIVYVDKVDSDHVIRYAGGVGDRRPLHATSSGKAILAFLSEDEREEILQSLSLARHTERTVTSLAALRTSLDEIRRTGVSVTTEEVVQGASGIAAPVFDRYGRVAGACAIGGPTDRVRPRLRMLATEVKATALALSARLGNPKPPLNMGAPHLRTPKPPLNMGAPHLRTPKPPLAKKSGRTS
jgi:IclR family transcriptional regulator, acetate operon repressor